MLKKRLSHNSFRVLTSFSVPKQADLFDPAITQSMFRELYFYRWPVETKYKKLKNQLATEEFSDVTTVSVFQEF